MRRDGPGHGGVQPGKQAGAGPTDSNGFLISKMIERASVMIALSSLARPTLPLRMGHQLILT